MTKEELREHCEKQVKACVMWAHSRDERPNGPMYEEHKLILDLIKSLEQQPEDCVSRQAVIEIINKSDACLYEKSDNNGLVEEIKTLPPVTPTFPKGATNGDVVEKIFGKDVYCTLIRMMYSSCCEKLKNWWNAPYKRGNLDGSN